MSIRFQDNALCIMVSKQDGLACEPLCKLLPYINTPPYITEVRYSFTSSKIRSYDCEILANWLHEHPNITTLRLATSLKYKVYEKAICKLLTMLCANNTSIHTLQLAFALSKEMIDSLKVLCGGSVRCLDIRIFKSNNNFQDLMNSISDMAEICIRGTNENLVYDDFFEHNHATLQRLSIEKARYFTDCTQLLRCHNLKLLKLEEVVGNPKISRFSQLSNLSALTITLNRNFKGKIQDVLNDLVQLVSTHQCLTQIIFYTQGISRETPLNASKLLDSLSNNQTITKFNLRREFDGYDISAASLARLFSNNSILQTLHLPIDTHYYYQEVHEIKAQLERNNTLSDITLFNTDLYEWIRTMNLNTSLIHMKGIQMKPEILKRNKAVTTTYFERLLKTINRYDFFSHSSKHTLFE